MQTVKMMAGDAFALPIEIETESGIAGAGSFESVEVCIGCLSKTTTDGEVTYDEENGVYNVALSQEETFRLRGKNLVQVRVKLANEDVLGEEVGYLVIEGSLSKAVL